MTAAQFVSKLLHVTVQVMASVTLEIGSRSFIFKFYIDSHDKHLCCENVDLPQLVFNHCSNTCHKFQKDGLYDLET